LNAVVSLLSGVGFFVLIILTRPDKEVIPIDDYYDASIGKFVQKFDVKLKFAGNPLFRKIMVFEYVGDLKYEITAMEFGSFEKVLVQGAYEDQKKKDHREITITEKSLLSKRKVPMLKIVTETDAKNYLKGVSARVGAAGIVLSNENKSPVRHYPVPCTGLTTKQANALKASPKVEDAYPDGANLKVIVKEVPAGFMDRPGTDTIRF
jgi:hypothetical protein